MNKKLAFQLAEALGVPIKGPDSRGYVHMRCPFAPWKHSGGTDSNPSFGIPLNNGLSKAYCFSCHSGGETRTWLAELHQLGFKAESWQAAMEVADKEEEELEWPSFQEEAVKKDIQPFPEDWLNSYPSASNSPSASLYLDSRGISSWDIERWEIKYDGFRSRICFPHRSRNGVLVGMEGRTILEDVKPKYYQYLHEGHKNPEFLMGENYIDPDLPVVLVEGPFDIMRVARVYENVLALSGTTLTEGKLNRLTEYFEFVPLLDQDDAGISSLKYLKKWAGKNKIVRVPTMPKGKDPGSLTSEEMYDVLKGYVPDTHLAID